MGVGTLCNATPRENTTQTKTRSKQHDSTNEEETKMSDKRRAGKVGAGGKHVQYHGQGICRSGVEDVR